jgi:hypothetical protein
LALILDPWLDRSRFNAVACLVEFREYLRFRVPAPSCAGVKEAPSAGFIEPSLATARANPPTGALWQYEIKLDGYRV